MKLTDFNKLKKFMNMTFSDNETERNGALAKANEILRKDGLTWDRVLDKVVQLEVEDMDQIEDAPTSPFRRDPESERINQAFRDIDETDPQGGFADFITSLKKQWLERGSLSALQLEALFKGAERANNRGKR